MKVDKILKSQLPDTDIVAFEVTDAHVLFSMRQDPNKCAVAVALKERFVESSQVIVNCSSVKIFRGDDFGSVYDPSEELRTAIAGFDHSGDFKPGWYTMTERPGMNLS